MIVESDGLKWLVDEQPSGDRIGPDHEKNLRERILALIPEGGTFIDVGAHVGCYSLRAAATKKAFVYAIEPNPDTVRRLEANCGLNNLWTIFVYPIAAWNEVTPVTLDSPNGFPRDASTRVEAVPFSDETVVAGIPLDVVLRHLSRADLLKLDVEGSDLRALEGMRDLVKRLRPTMIIEDHSVLGYFEPQELQDKIRSLDYTAEIFGTYGGANYWICQPPKELM